METKMDCFVAALLAMTRLVEKKMDCFVAAVLAMTRLVV